MMEKVKREGDPGEIRIALPGDVILCWTCGAEVARFVDGTYQRTRLELQILPNGRQVKTAEGRILFCRACGGDAGIRGPGGGRADENPRPQVRIRSGSWTGWRDLGGE